jgi:hypothetical protein
MIDASAYFGPGGGSQFWRLQYLDTHSPPVDLYYYETCLRGIYGLFYISYKSQDVLSIHRAVVV